MVAVERAVAGADGPLDSLDRDAVFTPRLITEELGTRWEIERTYLKPYASCRYTHASIDAVLELIGGRALRGEDIDALRVEVFPEAFTIANERAPQTLEGAQFSIPFCLALAALRGAAAFRPLQPVSLADPEVVRLSERVEMVVGDDFTASFPAAVPSRVRLVVRGEALERAVIHPMGDVETPLSAEQLGEKLRDLTRGIPTLDPGRLELAIAGLEEEGPSPLLAELAVEHP